MMSISLLKYKRFYWNVPFNFALVLFDLPSSCIESGERGDPGLPGTGKLPNEFVNAVKFDNSIVFDEFEWIKLSVSCALIIYFFSISDGIPGKVTTVNRRAIGKREVTYFISGQVGPAGEKGSKGDLGPIGECVEFDWRVKEFQWLWKTLAFIVRWN